MSLLYTVLLQNLSILIKKSPGNMSNTNLNYPTPFRKIQAFLIFAHSNTDLVSLYELYLADTEVTISNLTIQYQEQCYVKDDLIFEVMVQNPNYTYNNDFNTGTPTFISFCEGDQSKKMGFGMMIQPYHVSGVGALWGFPTQSRFSIPNFTIQKGDRLFIKTMRYNGSFSSDELYGKMLVTFAVVH